MTVEGRLAPRCCSDCFSVFLSGSFLSSRPLVLFLSSASCRFLSPACSPGVGCSCLGLASLGFVAIPVALVLFLCCFLLVHRGKSGSPCHACSCHSPASPSTHSLSLLVLLHYHLSLLRARNGICYQTYRRLLVASPNTHPLVPCCSSVRILAIGTLPAALLFSSALPCPRFSSACRAFPLSCAALP